MQILVGTIVKKDDKILMVKEAKKECYGKWDFPTGRLEENEDIFEGAKRETLEESGYCVAIKKMLPIQLIKNNRGLLTRYMFLAEIVDYDETKILKDEILEARFFSIDEIKNMKKELRAEKEMLDLLKVIEENRFLELDEAFIK